MRLHLHQVVEDPSHWKILQEKRSESNFNVSSINNRKTCIISIISSVRAEETTCEQNTDMSEHDAKCTCTDWIT